MRALYFLKLLKFEYIKCLPNIEILPLDTILQETVLYIKWVSLLDKSGNEVFAASESEKLVMLSNTRQDLTWAEAVPDKYLAAKAMIML